MVHFSVQWVLVLARVHKSAVLEAVVFEHTLLGLSDTEGLNDSLILEFQTCLCSTILHQAQHLHVKDWVLDEAPVTTYIFVLDLSLAHIALVLNFNKLGVDYETKNFYDIANYLVCGDGLYQTDCVFGLKVSHLILDVADHFEITCAEMELRIDIKIVADFSQCIFH